MAGLNFFQRRHSYDTEYGFSFLARALPLASLSGNPSKAGYVRPRFLLPLYTGAFFCLKFTDTPYNSSHLASVSWASTTPLCFKAENNCTVTSLFSL